MQYEYFTNVGTPVPNDDQSDYSSEFEQFSYHPIAENEANLTFSSPSASSLFYQHIILPSDTLQGICLQYKISAIKLRQVNRFSSSSLLLAPKRLIIPRRKGVIIKEQDKGSREFKIHYVKAEYERLNTKEIKAYLEMTDWSVERALSVIKDDLLWERQNNNKENVGPVLSGGIRENCVRIEKVKKELARLRNLDTEEEPLLVVGLPVDINVMKGNVRRAIHTDVHLQAQSEFGIELKDFSNYDKMSTNSCSNSTPVLIHSK